MDKNVIPLVKYFNENGLKTVMSCEGHNKTNMSMFWIEFDASVTEQDIINFQKRHLENHYYSFSSCGRFAERLFVAPKIIKRWYYFAATKEAANQDLKNWKNDDSGVKYGTRN